MPYDEENDLDTIFAELDACKGRPERSKTKRELELEAAWARIPAAEKEKMAALGIEGPTCSERPPRRERRVVQEADAQRAVYSDASEQAKELQVVFGKTALDEIIAKEEKAVAARAGQTAEIETRMEAVSFLLSVLFRPFNRNQEPTPYQVVCRLYSLCRNVRPYLVRRWATLDEMAKMLGTTKQVLSKQEIKQNAMLNLKTVNAKTPWQISRYAEGSLKWHAQRKAAKRREQVSEYNRNYRLANRDAIIEREHRYYEANKERILARRRKRRKLVETVLK